MCSRQRELFRSTGAWRISIWPTVAFAVCSAAAFAIVYLLVARGINERSDAWLQGEVEVLAEVSANAPRDSLYNRLMEEVAEHASREVPDAGQMQDGRRWHSVFFLLARPGEEPIWVGPDDRDSFIAVLNRAQLSEGRPASMQFNGYRLPFRVVYQVTADGGRLYLGFADIAAARFLRQLLQRFALIWLGMAALGFFISSFGAYRTLLRVEHITDTVARIGSEDLASRLPDGRNDDEISRLSRTFNRMLDRIQASVHQLRVVTDSVAHDLKSPVTAIRGRLEEALLRDGHAWQEPVAEAIEQLDRLSQMLNNTLDMSEAEAGALQLRREPLDLAGMVQQITELYEPALAERKHTLTFELDPGTIIEGDPSFLNRAIANLLDNEVAHLPPGCHIRVVVRNGENDAELIIEDDGPGFPAEVRGRAFERFVKGGHSSGHGLGLAFVNAVVQAHGGSVSVSEGDAGRGTKITVALRLAKLAAPVVVV